MFGEVKMSAQRSPQCRLLLPHIFDHLRATCGTQACQTETRQRERALHQPLHELPVLHGLRHQVLRVQQTPLPRGRVPKPRDERVAGHLVHRVGGQTRPRDAEIDVRGAEPRATKHEALDVGR